jgi:T1SS-143 domain-containing protein
MAKPTSGNVSINLDQWADGPVLQGDVDGTGQNQEVFVNGNLNAQKAHYNEGDAIPYRAIMDNLEPGVTYGLVIQWDTVDSGAYALDYLTGFNFSFDGTKHPGEPDVNPLLGVTGISSGSITLAGIQSDPQLLTGFGAQFGITDGLSSGTPSGAQSISLFGSVSGATVSTVTYNADFTKASVTVSFMYTGSAADNADTVVVAWGGHIASSLDWHDDAGETVQTASDINGSPYHMRVLSLVVDGTVTSVGNQDRSLSADAVLPPEPPVTVAVDLIADDDDTANGIGDSADGDDAASVPAITPLGVTGAISVDFSDVHLDPVLDTSSAAVKSGGVALFYFWDAAGSTLYASTDVTSAATAAATVVFSIALQESGGLFDYFFSSTGQIDHPAGSTENNVLVDVTFTATGQGGTTANGTFHLSFDDDIPVRASATTPVTATVEEDGMSSAVTPEAGGLNGDDQSLGNPGAGDTLADDQASGAIGSLTALVDVGADQPGTFTLSSVTTSLPTLFSKGDAVTYAVTDSGDADVLLDTLTATAGGRTVFTLQVNPDGSWAFDLDDQLDHVDDDLNTENTALRTNLAGTTSVGSIDFSSMIQVTDFDGDTVAPLLAGDFAITVQDDIPVRAANPQAVTATVEEDGMSSAVTPEAGGLNGDDQSLGNPGAGDTLADDQASGTVGSLTALMSVGADEPPTISLSSVTTSLPTLFSKGDAVTYAVTDSGDPDSLLDTLTATAGGRTVFTLQVNPDGSWAFDLDDQLDHVAGDGENTALRTAADGSTSTASIDFSAIVQVTDFDGDTVAPLLAGDFAVTVEDDIPVFNSITNVVAFNTGDPMTGMYSAGVGADEPGDIVLLTLAGTAPSGRAIFNVVLNQDSSTVTSFSFDYFTKVSPSTDSLTATGTVTFNANGTYVVDLDGPILGGTTFSTSGGTNLDYDTTGNNSPEITVKAYTSDFFGVLTGQSSVPLSDTTDLVTDDSDHSFAAGDTFKSVGTAYVNVSTDTVGVNSDTVQNGELLNYDFYTANPVSPASPSGPPPVSTPTAVIVASTEKAFVDTVDITLNQINVGKEDIAILLKLFNADTDDFTTKLLLANASSDYQAIAGSTDVKVSVTEDDYQDGYRIYGMQILTSTEDITGTGFSLSDGSVVNLTSSGNDLADTSDGDVMKIIRIEVTANLPGDSDLAFTGKMVDEDGDETSNFGFSVHLEGDSEVLTGGAGSDYLNGTAAADTMSGGAGADFMFGGAGADVFQFASGDSGITLGTADTILDFLTGVDKIATSKAAGNATIAAGAGLADLAAFFGAADAVLTAGAGTNDVYVAYDAAGSGNAWAVVDENDTGSVDAGDTLIVLAGINAAAEIAATDFV